MFMPKDPFKCGCKVNSVVVRICTKNIVSYNVRCWSIGHKVLKFAPEIRLPTRKLNQSVPPQPPTKSSADRAPKKSVNTKVEQKSQSGTSSHLGSKLPCCHWYFGKSFAPEKGRSCTKKICAQLPRRHYCIIGLCTQVPTNLYHLPIITKSNET